MTSFQKDQDGNLNIIPDAVQPEMVVLSRGHVDRELVEAKAHRDRLASELALAEENVTQKQSVVAKCIELGVVVE